MKRAGLFLIFQNPEDITDINSKILCVRRGKDSDKLGLPGGGAEDYETFLITAMRELHEECGIKINSINLDFNFSEEEIYTGTTWKVETFLGKYDNQEIISSDEGEVVWATWKELLTNTPFKSYNMKLWEYVISNPEVIQGQWIDVKYDG